MIIFTNISTKEQRAKVLLQYSRGEYGTTKQPIPKEEFLSNALHKEGLVELFIKAKDINV